MSDEGYVLVPSNRNIKLFADRIESLDDVRWIFGMLDLHVTKELVPDNCKHLFEEFDNEQP